LNLEIGTERRIRSHSKTLIRDRGCLFLSRFFPLSFFLRLPGFQLLQAPFDEDFGG